MKLLSRMFAGIVLVSCFAMPAFADKCKDPIVDEMESLSASDQARIEKSMNALTQKGADVRVHVVSSFHRNDAGKMNASLDDYKSMMKDKCKSWQAPNGGMKNNLVLVIVAPKQKQSGLYNGDQWQGAIEPVRRQIYDGTMNPRFREGHIGDGIAKALDDVIDVVSVKPSQANKPVTIVHAADNSGLWSVLGWLVVLGALVLAIILAFRIFNAREKRRGAQRNAQTERSKCTQAVNAFDLSLAVLDAKVQQADVTAEWKTALNEKLDLARAHQSTASASMSALDRSANNPDTPNLSVEEYAGMEQRFASVAGEFDVASRLLENVESNLRHALRGEPVPASIGAVQKTDSVADVPSEAPATHPERDQERHPAPSHTPPSAPESRRGYYKTRWTRAEREAARDAISAVKRELEAVERLSSAQNYHYTFSQQRDMLSGELRKLEARLNDHGPEGIATEAGRIQDRARSLRLAMQHAPSHLVEYHESNDASSFVTGMIVGNALGHHHDDRMIIVHHGEHRSTDPIIATPDFDQPTKRSDGGGKGDDWGKTSDGNGTSSNWGTTSDGNGTSSNWGSSASEDKSGTSY